MAMRCKLFKSLSAIGFTVFLAFLFYSESASGNSLENGFYQVIKVFEKSYGATNFDGLLKKEGFSGALKKGGNNVPRSLAATALVHAFVFRKEGNQKDLEKATYLINVLIEKYPFWTASLKPPNISFNLAPTTAYNLGLASWLIWNDLEITVRRAVKDMLIKESNFMLLRTPASGFVNDTKADENGVVPPLLSLTAILFPNEENSQKWEAHSMCYAYHSITTTKDIPYCDVITQTAYDNFLMDNHGIHPHPLYMAAPLVLFADASLVYLTADREVPWELKHNAVSLWNRLKTFVNKDFTWNTHNSWNPTGLGREISAVTYIAVIMGVDTNMEIDLVNQKIRSQGFFVEKKVGVVKSISTYDENFFNNALVAKRYIVSFLLHEPTFLTKPPLSMD